MELILHKDKETKGAVRFADMNNHNLYLRKEEAAELGNPEHILVSVSEMKSS